MYFEDFEKGKTFEIAPGVMSFMSVWAKYLEIDLAGVNQNRIVSVF